MEHGLAGDRHDAPCDGRMDRAEGEAARVELLSWKERDECMLAYTV